MNTVSKLELKSLIDRKIYTFINMIPNGKFSITVTEFKEGYVPITPIERLTELIKKNESNKNLQIQFAKPFILGNHSFSGYWSTGKTNVKNEENVFMYFAVLTDNKEVSMTAVAVYYKESDLVMVNKVMNSIKFHKQ